jgi:predicted TIM-barrel fold metal-dependent hydrolase
MPIIDAHVHVWPKYTAAYPLAEGFNPADMAPASFTPEELMSHCRPAGVSRVVLIQMSYFGTDNRYMTDVMAAWGGTFAGVAVVDWQAPELGEELARLRGLGVRGVRVQPGDSTPEAWLADPAGEALCGLCGELGMAVCPLVGPVYLPAVARAARRFPGTLFVVDHLARIGCAGPVTEADVQALCDLAASPNCLAKVSAFYALGAKRPPHEDLIPVIRRVWEAFGAERLMWASDCPFQVVDESYEDSLSLARDRLEFLTDAGREALLGGTAERVFFGA